MHRAGAKMVGTSWRALATLDLTTTAYKHVNRAPGREDVIKSCSYLLVSIVKLLMYYSSLLIL